jgi:uncharacterized integral membrane protein
VPPPGPDPTKNAPRAIVAALIGAEAGAAIGLLFFGSTPFAPIGLALFLAVVASIATASLRGARLWLFQRELRRRLRSGHSV